MLEKELVSLIVPCYNGEKFLNRCIDCILKQTYSKIQLIFVNDGSLDNTENLILARKNEIENTLCDFKYLFQKNQGVGAAVNSALKVVSGEYITLLDVDDYMMAESIEIRVRWLINHQDYTLVRNNGYFVTEDNFYSTEKLFTSEEKFPDNVFSSIIDGETYAWAGTYMVRTANLLQYYPNREIYPSRSGQNMQIILPVAYNGKAGFISKPLMRYMIQNDSLCHFSDESTGEKYIIATYNYEDIYNNVISIICTGDEQIKWKNRTRATFARNRMYIAKDYKDKKVMKTAYRELCETGCCSLDNRIMYAAMCRPIYAIVLRGLRKIKHMKKNWRSDDNN